jgi:hypothetical protein
MTRCSAQWPTKASAPGGLTRHTRHFGTSKSPLGGAKLAQEQLLSDSRGKEGERNKKKVKRAKQICRKKGKNIRPWRSLKKQWNFRNTITFYSNNRSEPYPGLINELNSTFLLSGTNINTVEIYIFKKSL